MKFFLLGRLQCEVSLAGKVAAGSFSGWEGCSVKFLWLGRLQCKVSLVGKVAV